MTKLLPQWSLSGVRGKIKIPTVILPFFVPGSGGPQFFMLAEMNGSGVTIYSAEFYPDARVCSRAAASLSKVWKATLQNTFKKTRTALQGFGTGSKFFVLDAATVNPGDAAVPPLLPSYTVLALFNAIGMAVKLDRSWSEETLVARTVRCTP